MYVHWRLNSVESLLSFKPPLGYLQYCWIIHSLPFLSYFYASLHTWHAPMIIFSAFFIHSHFLSSFLAFFPPCVCNYIPFYSFLLILSVCKFSSRSFIDSYCLCVHVTLSFSICLLNAHLHISCKHIDCKPPCQSSLWVDTSFM